MLWSSYGNRTGALEAAAAVTITEAGVRASAPALLIELVGSSEAACEIMAVISAGEVWSGRVRVPAASAPRSHTHGEQGAMDPLMTTQNGFNFSAQAPRHHAMWPGPAHAGNPFGSVAGLLATLQVSFQGDPRYTACAWASAGQETNNIARPGGLHVTLDAARS